MQFQIFCVNLYYYKLVSIYKFYYYAISNSASVNESFITNIYLFFKYELYFKNTFTSARGSCFLLATPMHERQTRKAPRQN